MESNPNIRKASAIGGMTAIIVGVLLLALFTSSLKTVEAGYSGVKTRFGKTVDGSLGPGLHFKMPWVERITPVEVREQKMTLDTSASSKDLQTVQSSIVINFHPVADKVDELYNQVGLDYEDRILNPAVEEAVKAVTAAYTAVELISERTLVRNKMEDMLRERLQDNQLVITKFNITNFQFSSAFNDAIENKQTAEQEALRAQNDLVRVKFEADQKIEEARGAAESIKLRAEAEAEAVRLMAAAEAESIGLKADAEAAAHKTLAATINRDVIELRTVEKWDGIMPRVTGDAIPMLNLSEKELE